MVDKTKSAHYSDWMTLKKILQTVCVTSLFSFTGLIATYHVTTGETVEQSLFLAIKAMEEGKDSLAEAKILQATIRVFVQKQKDAVDCQVMESSKKFNVAQWCTTDNDNENEREITSEIRLAIQHLKWRGHEFKNVALLFYPDTTFKQKILKQNQAIDKEEILKEAYPQVFSALEDAKDSLEESVRDDIDTQYESALSARANIIHIEEWPKPKKYWAPFYEAILESTTNSPEDTRSKIYLHTRFAVYHEYGHFVDQNLSGALHNSTHREENNFQQEAFADLFAASMLAEDYHIDMKKIVLGLAEMRRTKDDDKVEELEEHDIGGFLARMAEYPLETMSTKQLNKLSKSNVILLEIDTPMRTKKELLREQFGRNVIPAKLVLPKY